MIMNKCLLTSTTRLNNVYRILVNRYYSTPKPQGDVTPNMERDAGFLDGATEEVNQTTLDAKKGEATKTITYAGVKVDVKDDNKSTT
ncbi:hypothetical protein AKO1_008102, partial [Acrasis kona]